MRSTDFRSPTDPPALRPPPGAPRRYSTRPLPSYRHVPGLTPHPIRDPAGHSHGREELPPSAPCRRLPGAWHECGEYLYGIDLFNRAFLWEAHEAWETVWIGAGKRSRPGQFVQGLVQVSASLLRAHLGTAGGSRSLWRKAESRFASVDEWLHRRGLGVYMGIALEAWRCSVELFLAGRGSYPFLRPEWSWAADEERS